MIEKIQQAIKTEKRTQSAVKQILYSFLFQGVNIAINLLYVPLLLKYLDQEQYGIWLVLTSILTWFSFFDIGLSNGLRNKLTEALAIKDIKLGKKLVSTTYFMISAIFLSALIIFQICNIFIDWKSLLNSKNISERDLYYLTSYVFTFFFMRFILQTISVVYIANQRPSFSHMINTMANLVSIIFIFILKLIYIKGDLIMPGLIISAVPVLILVLVSIVSFNGKYKILKPSLKFVTISVRKELLTLGFKFFFLQLTAIFFYSTSSFFIARYYGPEEVVVYNIAYKYFQLPIFVYTIILAPLWSSVTDAFAKKDYIWMKNTIKRLLLLSIFFSVGVILMLLISNKVYKIWTTSEVNIPFNLSISLAALTIIQIFIAPYSYFINGTGKIKLTMISSSLGVLIYLVVICLFSKYFVNSTGFVIAVIITSLTSLVQPWQSYKILKGNAKGILLK